MGVLEGAVVAAILIAGFYVGYHAWQEFLDAPEDGEAHSLDPGFLQHGLQATEMRPPLHVQSLAAVSG